MCFCETARPANLHKMVTRLDFRGRTAQAYYRVKLNMYVMAWYSTCCECLGNPSLIIRIHVKVDSQLHKAVL